jgi:peptide/nickel transport system permease protein
MITGARGYFKAWWLAIFPGLAIFLTVTIFNLLGEGLTDAMDPRLKQ